MMAILITLISFFLEATFSLYIPLASHFVAPLFTLVSIFLGSSSFYRKKDYYIYCFCTGLFYDLITNTLFLHAILFCILGYLFQKSLSWFSETWYNFLLLLFLMMIIYRICSYSILLLTGYVLFDMVVFLYTLVASFIPNLLYGLLLYELQYQIYHKHIPQLKKF